MTLPGFIILVVLFLLGIWIYVEMARFPGRKARERGHPQADAINVLAWVGLLLGVAPWVVALVWAYTRPIGLAATAETGGRGAEAGAETAEITPASAREET